MNDHQELRKSVQEQTYSYPEHVTALLADFDRVKAERDEFRTALEIIGTMDTVANPHHTSVNIARKALLKGSE